MDDRMNSFAKLFESLLQAVNAGRRVAFCAVVSSRGSTPQTPGASMLLHDDMRSEGTLGGGCVEAEVRRRAFELLQAGRSGLLHFDLDHDYGWDDGLLCGGQMDVAVVPVLSREQAAPFANAAEELGSQRLARVPLVVRREEHAEAYVLCVEPSPTVWIAGAGHVGQALARLAVDLDYRVIVIDDRADCANPSRFGPPIEIIVADIEQTLRAAPIDANSYVVIVTRGHRHDEKALAAVIDSPARYIGMIGSRRKIKLLFDDLATAGVDRAKLDRVHSPIGLKIGAVTVPEIAISIAAEMTQVRRADAGSHTHIEGPAPSPPL
jgi:xanthine dehydrogenase accessory factor